MLRINQSIQSQDKSDTKLNSKPSCPPSASSTPASQPLIVYKTRNDNLNQPPRIRVLQTAPQAPSEFPAASSKRSLALIHFTAPVAVYRRRRAIIRYRALVALFLYRHRSRFFASSTTFLVVVTAMGGIRGCPKMPPKRRSRV